MSMEAIMQATSRAGMVLKLYRGHFATGHSHINYYIDITKQRFNLNEARRVAQELASEYKLYTPVDTILSLDNTEVIAACMASELTKTQLVNINQDRDINVVTPERTVGSQLIFRENSVDMIAGKNVLILMASVVTGYTAKSAIEAITYYGGKTVGVSSIFATVKELGGLPVRALFDPSDLPGYATHDASGCPLCRGGVPLDAIVSSFGYSKL